MNKSIELSNLIREKDDLDDEKTKLEVKEIDNSEEVNPDSMKNCIIAGVIFLIIVIILSILAVNYILNPNSN
jgi:hypothetical protein